MRREHIHDTRCGARPCDTFRQPSELNSDGGHVGFSGRVDA